MQSPYDQSRLKSESKLYQGQCLISKSKNYYAVLQSDGNFIVYVSCHFHPKNILWSSNTTGSGLNPYYLYCEKSGNLTLFDSKGKSLWATHTTNNGSPPYELVMQDDGNLVFLDSTMKVLWSTNTKRI